MSRTAADAKDLVAVVNTVMEIHGDLKVARTLLDDLRACCPASGTEVYLALDQIDVVMLRLVRLARVTEGASRGVASEVSINPISVQ